MVVEDLLVHDHSMTSPDSPPPLTRSVIGRLLDELSWVGKSIRDYRDGGIGYENVLVAETLLALDFLPRARFLGAVLASATGADEARSKAIADVEDADLTVLPPEIKLRASAGSYQLVVQPDASLVGTTSWTLIEAKRLKQGSFQQEQLAREYVSVTREAAGRVPLLLFIIPAEPPVSVKGLGQMSPQEAIEATLSRVLEKTEAQTLNLQTLTESIPQTLAWVTWEQLGTAVQKSRDAFKTDDDSVAGTINRLCDLIADSIHRHGKRSG